MVIAARFDKSPELAGAGAAAERDSRRILRLEAQGRTAAGAAAQVLVHNISASGLLLESEVALRVGERIDIELPHAGTVSARVVWASGSFFGCQFDAPLSTAALSAAQLRGHAVPGATPGPDNAQRGGEAFGARLHRLRKARGLTLSTLAAELGVSKPTVWAWEQGKARPVAARLAALAKALETTVPDLLGGPGGTPADGAIERARVQIAGALGVAAERVRIVVEL